MECEIPRRKVMDAITRLDNVTGTSRRKRSASGVSKSNSLWHDIFVQAGGGDVYEHISSGSDTFQSSAYDENIYTSYSSKNGHVKVSGGVHSTHILFSADPRHVEVTRIHNYMRKGVREYFSGMIGASQVADIIEHMYRDILAYNVTMRKTNGSDPNFNGALLRDTHSTFIMRTLETLWLDNQTEGDAYARANKGLSITDCFVYYNARYYHANKALQTTCDATIAGIAKKEGIPDYSVSKVRSEIHPYNYCFNSRWSYDASYDAHISKIKNTHLEPPDDFVMYFASDRYSRAARDKGETYYISAIDLLHSGEPVCYSFFIKVPKGESLFKPLPFELKESKENVADPSGSGYVAGVYDITDHLEAGEMFRSSLKEFFSDYLNTCEHGELIVWHKGSVSEHSVPFDLYFEGKKQFNGSELTLAADHCGFISNFEFHWFTMFE